MNKINHMYNNKRNIIISLGAIVIIAGLIGIAVAFNTNNVTKQAQVDSDANIYLKLTSNGVDIVGTGDGMVGNVDVTDLIAVDSFRGGLSTPVDAGSALASGQRQYQPIVITKDLDKSSPLISKSLAQNEQIEAVFSYFALDNSGTKIEYYRITIQDALISSQRTYSITLDDGTIKHMEEVSFVFARITWLYVIDGIEFTDTIGPSAYLK